MPLGRQKVADYVPVTDQEMELRRRAVAICAALPPNLNDALAVLDLARGLVTDFLARRP